jgi:hypothetical protein
VGPILSRKENTKALAIFQRKAERQISRIVKQHALFENVTIAQLMTVRRSGTL